MNKLFLTLTLSLSLLASGSMMAANSSDNPDAPKKERRHDGKKDKKRKRKCSLTPCEVGNTCGNPQCRPGQNPCCPPEREVCPEENDCLPAPCLDDNNCNPQCRPGQTLCCPSEREVCPKENACNAVEECNTPCFPKGEGACFQPRPKDTRNVAKVAGGRKENPLMRGIELTPAQKEQAKALDSKYGDKRKEMRHKHAEKKAKLNKEFDKDRTKLRSSYEKDLEKVLTPEQRAIYIQNKAKMEERRNQSGCDRYRRHCGRHLGPSNTVPAPKPERLYTPEQQEAPAARIAE